jgi:hypothetical protein
VRSRCRHPYVRCRIPCTCTAVSIRHISSTVSASSSRGTPLDAADKDDVVPCAVSNRSGSSTHVCPHTPDPGEHQEDLSISNRISMICGNRRAR